MSESMGTRVVWGGSLTFSALMISRLINFLSMIYLVRILLPEDFGLTAMAFSVLTSVALVTGFGTTHAIVHSSSKPKDLGIAALGISWLSGLPLFVLVLVYAEEISLLFGTDRVSELLKYLAPLILVSAMSGVPFAFLQKHMQYERRAVVLISCELVNACVSVFAAATGHGLWSLVYGKIARDLTLLVLPWSLSQPKEWFRFALPPWSVTKEVLSFGSQTLAFSLLVLFTTAWYTLLLGRVLGVAAVGFYTRAWGFATIPLEQLVQPLAGVLFPAYAKLQNDPARLRRAYLRSIQIFSLVTFPILTGLCAVSREFVCGVMGEAWLPMISTLQVLSLMSVFRILPMTLSPLFLGTGVPRYNIWISGIEAVSTVALTLPTVQYGLFWVAFAGSLSRMFGALYALSALNKVLPDIRAELGRLVLAPAAGCGVMMGGIWAIRPVLHTMFSDPCGIEVLVSLILVGAGLYAGSVVLLDRKILGVVGEIWSSFKSSSLGR